jgi:LysR family transcriptional regulator, transcriptional activator of the cysJI operon
VESFRLKVFRVAAEELSFTRAAEKLFLTQPAVTMQVKNLEDELRLRLFDRTGQRLALTPAGVVLRDYAMRVAALCTEAEEHLAALRGETVGRLALAASTTIAQYLLPAIAGAFIREHPGVELDIMSANTAGAVAALVEGRVRLALIEGPAGRSDVKTEPFIEDRLPLIAPPGHEWAEAGVIDPVKLANAPLIMRERGSGTRDVVERALRKAGLALKKLRVVMELDSTEAVKSAVRAGLGVGFVSEWALSRELALGMLKEVAVKNMEIRRDFLFVYPRGPEPEGIEGAFLKFARFNRQELQS